MFKLVFIVVFSAFIWNCSSQVAFSGKKKPDVDSVLFYQQMNLSDSFIDSILIHPGNLAIIRIPGDMRCRKIDLQQ